MARDAVGKLREASEIDKEADRLRKRDPVTATQLDDIARAKRKSAVKQMKRRPGRSGTRVPRVFES